jgi:hypothetical protein
MFIGKMAFKEIEDRVGTGSLKVVKTLVGLNVIVGTNIVRDKLLQKFVTTKVGRTKVVRTKTFRTNVIRTKVHKKMSTMLDHKCLKLLRKTLLLSRCDIILLMIGSS